MWYEPLAAPAIILQEATQKPGFQQPSISPQNNNLDSRYLCMNPKDHNTSYILPRHKDGFNSSK